MILTTFIGTICILLRGSLFCNCIIKVGKLLFHSRAAFVRCDKEKTTVYLDQLFLGGVLLYNNLCITTIFLKRCPRHCACVLAARCH